MIVSSNVCSELDRVSLEALTRLEQNGRPPLPSWLRALGEFVIQGYDRDDRVLRSLGHEPRSPFPKGQEVTRGDFRLPGPVRARGRRYRRVEGP